MFDQQALTDIWEPILSGSDLETARILIEHVARGQRNITPDLTSYAIAERALFFAYYSMAQRSEDYETVSIELLNLAIERLADENFIAPLSPYSGHLGVAWIVDHVSSLLNDDLRSAAEGQTVDLVDRLQNPQWDIPENDPLELYDDLLVRHLERLSAMNLSVDSGLIGIGLYAVERLPRKSSALILERVVDQIDRLSQYYYSGLAWYAFDGSHNTHGSCLPQSGVLRNSSTSNGVYGIVAFLVSLIQAGIEETRCRRMLIGAITGIIHEIRARPSRTRELRPLLHRECYSNGWCCETGAAAVLFRAALTVNDHDWLIASERYLLHEGSVRIATSDMSLCLCHGASGNAHIFNRMWQVSGNAVYKGVATAWYKKLFSLVHSHHLHCNVGVYSESDNEASGDTSIMSGGTGIALAILAAVTDVPPGWDRLMQISGRQPPTEKHGYERLRTVSIDASQREESDSARDEKVQSMEELDCSSRQLSSSSSLSADKYPQSPTRGVYFLANDEIYDIAVTFLSSFRSSNPEMPLCLIPYNSSFEKLRSLCSRYNFSIYTDEGILERCDQISKQFHGNVSGQYRKLAAWHGPFHEFVYIDSDTVVLGDIRFVFDFLQYFSILTSHSDMPQTRRWVWKNSIYSTRALTWEQISYAANTGFIASIRESVSIQKAEEKICEGLQLVPHMELLCAEQPFLNYLIVTSGRRYSSITNLRIRSGLSHLPVEAWGGAKISGIHKGRVTGQAPTVFLVHWAGQWAPTELDKKVNALLSWLLPQLRFKNVRRFMKNKRLWEYYHRLHCKAE